MSETKNVQVPFPMPEKLYKVIEGFFRSKALFAACEFGIFDKLRTASAQQSADEITKALSSDLDATTRLMDTLVAMEVLEKSKEGDQWLYSNSEMATKFLTKDSPDSYLDMIAPSRRIAIHDRRSGKFQRTIASHADVLRGSPRVPALLTSGAGTRDEPLRTSAWEANYKDQSEVTSTE